MRIHQILNVITDIVPNEAQDLEITYAMSNSLGFGGHNAVLVFKKFED